MSNLAETFSAAVASDQQPVGVIVVDHGSRRGESNDLLLAVAEMFRDGSGIDIVEPAHMELAKPTIADAFAKCVERGARTVVVFPYFLSPGRHWSEDIPRLAAEAAANHPGVSHLVTAPLGLHSLIGQVMAERIATCLMHHVAEGESCDWCAGESRCKLR
ncbi:CbiX/SirB N-terminal domain-containing protein [Aeoliella sp. SH292]|uniref:CbiX/SirB N-terminal domain-containing protein n=1 Tax=Aeoliella sp. SH292 TaxID=3454464 RepID=UPI003F972BFF